MRKHFPVQLHPWRCIHWYILTPDDVSDNTCWPLTMYCVLNSSRVRNPIHNFFFHNTVEKMFPDNRKPNNQDIILIYEMFYWSQYCKDYDNFSKVKCCYFLVTFLRKRPKIHKNGYTKMATQKWQWHRFIITLRVWYWNYFSTSAAITVKIFFLNLAIV